VPLDNFLADGQSDAGARELVPFVQPLEHAKDLFEILRLDSQSIVLYRKYPLLLAILGGGDVHPRDSGTLILDTVADKVLK